MFHPFIALCFACVALLVNADVPSYTEKHGYTDVRPGAHLFWWLYKADNALADRPLFLWLQGGPGASGTGYGNFRELGPVNYDQNPRDTTWLTKGDLVFVDNPVGTGYSYVDSSSAYTTNVDEIAADLVSWAKDFIHQNPEYSTRPFYITCESYGGKMGAQFAKYLYNAIQAGHINMNFKGAAIGDGWVSPIDFVTTWGPFLYYNFSKLDEGGFHAVQRKAMECQRYVDAGRWKAASDCWASLEQVVYEFSHQVSFYNVHKHRGQDPWSFADASPMERTYNLLVAPFNEEGGGPRSLSSLMNGPIKRKLGIPSHVRWGGQSYSVFAAQYEDFMKPVISTVDYLLAQTNLNITVYTGELDLICDVLGTQKWLNRLQWQYLSNFQHAPSVPFHTSHDPSAIAFYRQRYRNLAFYYIKNAGHMAPHDTPYATLKMLDMILGTET